MGLIAVVLPLVQGEANGWPLWGWLCLAAGVLAVTGLGILEARRRGATVPLLPARAFRLPAFSVGLAVQLLFAVGMQGFFLVFAIWLQGGEGYTPMQAGLVTVAFSVGGFLTAPAADALAVRFGRLVLAMRRAADGGRLRGGLVRRGPLRRGARRRLAARPRPARRRMADSASSWCRW